MKTCLPPRRGILAGTPRRPPTRSRRTRATTTQPPHARGPPCADLARAWNRVRRWPPIPSWGQPADPVGLEPHRSEEHTSELQSRFDLVCRLLLEKKKKKKKKHNKIKTKKNNKKKQHIQ